MAKEPTAATYQIWITKQWTIDVDERGYVIGDCFEGALGCVIQLHDCKDPGARFALKIPRLLADTIRENAYICALTEDEVRNAHLANADGGVGLIRAIPGEEPLKGRKFSLRGAPDEKGRQQANNVIFASFEKGKKPRLVSLNFDRELVVFPPGAKEELTKLIDADTWRTIEADSTDVNEQAFQKTVFVAQGGAADFPRAGVLENTIHQNPNTSIWYGGIPAIVYYWATGTLQQAVTTNQLGGWGIGDQYLLFKQILKGVNTLHAKKMIHGDIRPANVMYTGSVPESEQFGLTDYGSFAGEDVRLVGDLLLSSKTTSLLRTNTTTVAPAVGGHRITPFYAPERRAGVERESADTAVILHTPFGGPARSANPGAYFLRLGFRNELADGDKPKPAVLSDAKADLPRLERAQEVSASPDSLQKGDRIRVRDYLFQILHVGHTDGGDPGKTKENGKPDLICICDRRFAQIIHDRLAIYEFADVITDQAVITLGYYSEIRKWSAATDLYSVGAICLYCLFCSRGGSGAGPWPPRERAVDGDKEQTSSDLGNEAQVRNLDAQFGEMMEILESIPYFQSLWADLETFRRELDALYDQDHDKNAAEVANYKPALPLKEPKLTLRELALQGVNNIVQSAPNTLAILEKMNYNMADFLLFMHFAMSCMHRQSHLDKKDLVGAEEGATGKVSLPFCRDRGEAPKQDGPAKLALDRIAGLIDRLDRGFFKGFVCKAEERPKFNPKADYLVRQDNAKFESENAQLTAKLKEIANEDWIRRLLRALWSRNVDIKEHVSDRQI